VSDLPALITQPADLKQLVRRVAQVGRLAIDTEFVWERTYRAALGVVQIAVSDEEAWVVDACAVSLEPLFPILLDPKIPLILHGGGQDLEIFSTLMGEPARAVVDTQVEAAFLGYGLQVGLGSLLERVLKIRLRKDQTYTDWTKRPLRPEQLTYAREDVLHLLPMHDQMREELAQRGRLAWVDEELERLEDPARYAAPPDEDRYRNVKSWQRLRPKDLAVLRAAAAWRERTARRADVRPGFIVSDVVLTTLATRPVTKRDDLRGVRGLSSGTIDRHGRGLVTALREGVECPEAEWPEAPPRVRHAPMPSGLGALLRAMVQAVAEREEIASEIIASAREIDALGTLANRNGEPEGLRVLEGWRRDLVGETLLLIARGDLAIRYDPGEGEVVGEPVKRPSRR
jgi:ribonuclease D